MNCRPFILLSWGGKGCYFTIFCRLLVVTFVDFSYNAKVQF